MCGFFSEEYETWLDGKVVEILPPTNESASLTSADKESLMQYQGKVKVAHRHGEETLAMSDVLRVFDRPSGANADAQSANR